MYQPVLLYTTEEHGCSLTTFYIRVEHHEPTLLMIKTLNNEVSSGQGIDTFKFYHFMPLSITVFCGRLWLKLEVFRP